MEPYFFLPIQAARAPGFLTPLRPASSFLSAANLAPDPSFAFDGAFRFLGTCLPNVSGEFPLVIEMMFLNPGVTELHVEVGSLSL